MNLQLSARERFGALALAVLALIGLVFGWRLLWFLTDDAFITFRYVSNSMLGYGYVWNPPPFQPVEGYTSFLWTLLLDGVWRVTGMEPPVSANWLALIFATANILLTLLLLLRATAGKLRAWRLPITALALLGVLSNRTFLAWTSSGLETALFNCLVTLWVFCALTLPAESRRWAVAMSAAAALSALTRPDGLLLVATSAALIGLAALRAITTRRPFLPLIASAAPLLIVPTHLIWRYLTYGAWLPNTYFAKSSTMIDRLESGTRYLRSFVIEYGLWIWLALAIGWGIAMVVRVARRAADGPDVQPVARRAADRPDVQQVIGVAVVLTIMAHLAYYTYMIGGDHFEFRVYSHLIPLIFVSFVWMLGSLRLPPAAAAALLALFIVLSWPIPWTHWAESQRHQSRQDAYPLKLSIADLMGRQLPGAPGWLLAYLRFYDDDQAWLIKHAICLRHQEHKVFYMTMISTFPQRKLEVPTGPGEPVISAVSVGVIGWTYARVSVIDVLGLNDGVIARNPDLRVEGWMAHERHPPAGYLECFDLGLVKTDLTIHFVPAERIISCEASFRAQMEAANQAP